MSQAPIIADRPAVDPKALPPMTWNGTLVDAEETMTHYLHLSAFPCEKCNGPVITGSLGKRLDGISQETDIRKIGAACITCGFRPETMVEPSVGHHFRPVEWRWTIKPHALLAGLSDDLLSAELSQDADSQPESI